MKSFYITTPIYYPSGRFHLGTSYTTIAGDALKRYKEQQGFDVFYLTGTDEHGQKIAEKASQNGVSPKEFVDKFYDDIINLWDILDVKYDKFIRTTDDNHKEQVKEIFKRLHAKGYIYEGEYTGNYCVSCEEYFTEKQLVDGNKCPSCGSETKVLSEKSYFFKTSLFVDRLLKHYEDNPDFILPVSRKNELINSFIKPGLEDLSISRSNFTWGIPIPGDEDKVMYVWLDALSNYITALDFTSEGELYNKYWPADVHLMGKEIIRFHAIYWPMIQMALEIPVSKQVFAHGWLLMNNDKMSKSKGNVIYPEFIVERYGSDTLRYFLLREIPFGEDGYFTPASFINRINSDIVNDLGNLVNRTVSMVNKYFDGVVEYDEKLVSELIKEKHIDFDDIVTNFTKHMDNLHFSKGLEEVWKFISATNKFVDQTKPWELASLGKEKELNASLYVLVDSIRKISILISPVFTKLNKDIKKQINYDGPNNISDLSNVIEKYKVTDNPKPIYMRLEVEKEIEIIESEMKKA